MTALNFVELSCTEQRFSSTQRDTQSRKRTPLGSRPQFFTNNENRCRLVTCQAFLTTLRFPFLFPLILFRSFRRFNPSREMMAAEIRKVFVGLMKTSHHYFLYSIRRFFFVKLSTIKLSLQANFGTDRDDQSNKEKRFS